MSDVELEPTVSVEIDGQALQVPQGTMIIEAADNANIQIPRFCYHKKLSIAANCRMCLVEIENGRKPMPACATPVTDGMKVSTKSKKALQYQKAVMEFLLINHPLDCPICDQGGECELQDMSMGYGQDVSRYNQGKRVVEDKDIGPLIATDLTRCIHCTRCVRFGAEIAGQREMGMVSRGEDSHIQTFLTGHVASEMSGNVIDLCPVGALTSKPFRYQARAWELQQKPTVAPHDCIGSNLYAHIRREQLMRVVPRENPELNEMWLSDRDRFSYQALQSQQRLTSPMIKRDGEWETVAWSEVFDYLVKHLGKIVDKHGVDKIGAVASPSATTESLYLLQKLLRTFGCHNIDHRLHQCDFSHQEQFSAYPGIDGHLVDVENADVVLLVGSDVRHAQPIMHHRLRQASLQGAKVLSINPMDFDCRFEGAEACVVDIDDMVLVLAQCLKAVLMAQNKGEAYKGEVAKLLNEVEVSEQADAITKALLNAEKPVLLAGELLQDHPQAGLMLNLFSLLQHVLDAKGGMLTHGANTAGAWIAGALPHRTAAGMPSGKAGLNAQEMLTTHEPLKAYFLLETEPELDSVYGQRVIETLKAAKCVVALTAFVGDGLMDYADVLLPVSTFAETSGTFVNAFGDWQSFQGVAKAPGEARPAWKVLRVLANFMELEGFDYGSSQEVLAECQQQWQQADTQSVRFEAEVPQQLPASQSVLKRVALTPIYAGDMLVRRAEALQATPLMQDQEVVRISPALAKALAVESGDQVLIQQNNGAGVHLPVEVVDGLPDKSVFVPIGLAKTAVLGEAFDQISVLRV